MTRRAPISTLTHLGHWVQTASLSSHDCPSSLQCIWSSLRTLSSMGELPGEVHQHYLAELRSMRPAMADAYENTTHCTVSFFTDTTTLKLTQAWLAGSGKLTGDALYNLIVGQTVLPSCRDLKHWAPSELMPRRRLRSLPIAFASCIRGART